MMTELMPHSPGSELVDLTTEHLKRRLAEQMELSARHLVEMALIWTELENRGEDLSALRTSLTDYLPKIATGSLDAQAVVQFAGNRQLLRYFATLPIERQRELLDDGDVVIVLPASKNTTHRKLASMTGQEVTQVFGHGLVRSVDDQKRLLESKEKTRSATPKKSKATPAARIRYGSLEVDGERVQAGGKSLTAAQMLDMLSKHYGVDLTSMIGKDS